jgi:hypothetical protein
MELLLRPLLSIVMVLVPMLVPAEGLCARYC